MPFDPQKHHRHSVRLKGYDYSQSGVYFVTLCTWQRECIFGQVVADIFKPNPIGECVSAEWRKSVDLRAEIELDIWVLMPNHLHGLVHIQPTNPTHPGATEQSAVQIHVSNVGAHGRAPLPGGQGSVGGNGAPVQRAPRSLGSFIAGFKSAATTRINQLRQTPGLPVWQRNYHEHIIHTDHELQIIRRYIQNNPLQWALDNDNPLHNPSTTTIDYLNDALKRS